MLTRLSSGIRSIGFAGCVLLASASSQAQFGLGSVVGHVEIEEAPRTVPSFPKPTVKEAKIQQSLKWPVTVDWNDHPLEEALNDLEKQFGAEIWINKAALADEGIDSDQPVNLVIKDISAASVLKVILEPLGLAYVIEDEVLKITTQEDLDSKTVTRVYPVSDLFDTADEAKQLMETIECGLGLTKRDGEIPRFVVSARLKTLTVRDSYTVQSKVQELLLALRDAQTLTEIKRTGVTRDSIK